MITPRLTNCSSTPDILSLIKDIDHKLMSLSNDLYNNSVFMLNRQINAETFVDLIAYKRILTYKYCNEDYTNFTLPQIVTRVKRLTLGVNYIDCDDFVRTSTTSTTAGPTTTTSTSTTAIPTTTTTTTAVGTACGTPANYSGGYAYPSVNTINLGAGLGNVVFNFNAAYVPDKFEVWFDGVKVIDTGYRGSTSEQSALNAALTLLGDPLQTIVEPGNGTASFTKGTATTTAEVRIYAPLSGTYWTFVMNCPV